MIDNQLYAQAAKCRLQKWNSLLVWTHVAGVYVDI